MKRLMAPAVQRMRVPVAGGKLLVGQWGDGPKPIVGLHGMTANHMMFSPIVRRLGEGCSFLAPDMRGRGGSASLPGPFGMQAHAEDLVAVLDHLGIDAVTLAGVSMGGRPALRAAALHPNRVEHVILIDAGLPAPLPPGVDADTFITALLGPSLERLKTTFPNRSAYHEFWRAHPSMKDDWSADFEAYIDYDLIGDPPRLRSGVNPEAIRADTIDTLREQDSLGELFARIRCPVTLLRATRGVLNEPEPLFPQETVDWCRRVIPDFRDEIIENTNHFTIIFGDRPASLVAQRITSIATKGR